MTGRKRFWAGTFGALSVTVIGLIAVGRGASEWEAASPSPALLEGCGFVAPSGDPCRIAQASDVFLGQVVTRVAATPIAVIAGGGPDVVYVVAVIEPSKGGAGGTVLVHQHGGFDAVATPPAEGAPALAVGEVAVFVAVWAGDRGWYELVEGRFGYLRVADDPTRAGEIARIAKLAATPRS